MENVTKNLTKSKLLCSYLDGYLYIVFMSTFIGGAAIRETIQNLFALNKQHEKIHRAHKYLLLLIFQELFTTHILISIWFKFKYKNRINLIIKQPANDCSVNVCSKHMTSFKYSGCSFNLMIS